MRESCFAYDTPIERGSRRVFRRAARGFGPDLRIPQFEGDGRGKDYRESRGFWRDTVALQRQPFRRSTMAKESLKEMLNDAIAREIQVSVQYMWQHVQAVGIAGEVARPIFKQFAITEMKHAEEIAERLNMLGGIPTTKPTTITIGETK